MPSHLSDPWNNAVAYLELSFGGNGLSSGSGFFWKASPSTFLVTNWHNLAGRNPLTGQPMSPTGALPDRVGFAVLTKVGAADEQGFFEMRFQPVYCDLYEGGDFDRPKWLEHATLGRRADVAAIDVTNLVAGTMASHVNEIESDAVLDLAAAQDLFVVGFPYGLMAGAPVPLWKRGTIALDPNFDPEGLPKLLIDTATREGMSGSVAVARHVIVGRAYNRKDGTAAPIPLYATMHIVAGVYSGRHHPDFEKAQLGIVWKRHVIEDLVTSGRSPKLGLIG